MSEDPLSIGARRQYKRDLRRGLGNVAMVCAVALAVVGLVRCAPNDVAGASTTSQSQFNSWYADENNRAWYEWYQWYHADDRNRSYYHLRVIFGEGRLGDQAVRVAQCESELNPYARSRTNDHGTMQLNAVHRRQFERVTGRTWSYVYEPEFNVRYARYLWEQQGWGPWTCQP